MKVTDILKKHLFPCLGVSLLLPNRSPWERESGGGECDESSSTCCLYPLSWQPHSAPSSSKHSPVSSPPHPHFTPDGTGHNCSDVIISHHCNYFWLGSSTAKHDTETPGLPGCSRGPSSHSQAAACRAECGIQAGDQMVQRSSNILLYNMNNSIKDKNKTAQLRPRGVKFCRGKQLPYS